MEQNKIRTYTLYAIGEIALVVIGILIALQINTWNEQINDRFTECTYFSSLQKDLQDQIDIIDYQIEFESDVIRQSELLINDFYGSNQFMFDENFSRRISTTNNRVTFIGVSSTYQELLSTGNMSIISDTVKNPLLSYYQTLSQYEDSVSRNNLYIDNHYAPLVLEISTHTMPNLQINLFEEIIKKGWMSPEFDNSNMDLSPVHEEIQRRLNDPLKELNLLNNIQYRHRISGVHLSLMDVLKDQSNELMDLLNVEIRGCS